MQHVAFFLVYCCDYAALVRMLVVRGMSINTAAYVFINQQHEVSGLTLEVGVRWHFEMRGAWR